MKTLLLIENAEDSRLFVKHVEGGISFSISTSPYSKTEPVILPSEEVDYFISFLQKFTQKTSEFSPKTSEFLPKTSEKDER